MTKALPKDLTAKEVDDAFESTEDEIFASALEIDENDDDGDRTPENDGKGLEGEIVDEEDDGDDDGKDDEGKDGKTESKDDGKSKDEKDDESKDDDKEPETRGDQRLALREERNLRRAAEARETETKGEVNRLLTRLEKLERDVSAPRDTKPAKSEAEEEEPDVFADPQGFKQSILSAADKKYVMRRVEETFGDAHEAHGKEFEAAYGALTKLDTQSPTDRALVQRISNAANPGKALMRWHREQVVVREIGDPTTYEARTRERLLKDPETRKQLLKELRAEAEGRLDDDEGEERKPVRRNLPSLNSGARGSSGRGRQADPGLYDDSDEAVFDHATR